MLLMHRRDRGSMSVEAVLLAPLLVVMALFVVHLGRLASMQLRLVTIADQAARAASQVHPERMVYVGETSAIAGASSDGVACEKFEARVEVVRDADPQTVGVTVVCDLSRDGLSLLAPVPRQIRASSTEVVDRWRADS